MIKVVNDDVIHSRYSRCSRYSFSLFPLFIPVIHSRYSRYSFQLFPIFIPVISVIHFRYSRYSFRLFPLFILAILHRDSIPVRAFDLAGAPRPTTYERQMARIVAPSSSSVVIVNIYRPPSALISSFIDELDDLLGVIISDSNNKILLCGDFNCHGLDETHIDDGLLTVLESYGLQFDGP